MRSRPLLARIGLPFIGASHVPEGSPDGLETLGHRVQQPAVRFARAEICERQPELAQRGEHTTRDLAPRRLGHLAEGARLGSQKVVYGQDARQCRASLHAAR